MCDSPPLSKFLFQTGSIKSPDDRRGRRTVELFLFQTGSIKSSRWSAQAYRKLCFYSRLVRLKVRAVRIFKRYGHGFLFQTGSIKRKGFDPEDTRRFYCFYSRLVRLKVGRMCLSRCLWWLFLFQTGSIKRQKPVSSHLLSLRFYSRLVRLKADETKTETETEQGFYSRLVRLKDPARWCNAPSLWFLFQTGSIKSRVRIYAIWEIDGFYSRLVRLKVLCRGFVDRLRDVSIPDWFD